MLGLIRNNFRIRDPALLEQAIRLLMNVHGTDLSITDLAEFCGPEEAFLAIQKQIDVDYHDTPFKERALIAAGLASSPYSNSPSVFRLALQPGPLLPADIQDDSSGLLHSVAGAIGKIVFIACLDLLNEDIRDSEREFVKDLPGIISHSHV